MVNMAFSFKTPIGYAIAGSFFLHIILVSMYGNLLASDDVALPPPSAKKIRIEMVAKKLTPIKKIKVKEKKIIKPEAIAPIKIKKPRSARSAQKIREKEITLQAVPKLAPAKPRRALDQSIHSSKRSFQMAKANISAHSMVSKPRTIENLQTSEITTSKVQQSSTGKAKPAEFSPLPRPVENVRTSSKVTGKEVSFHASAVGFAPSSLPHARAVAPANTRGALQTKVMKFKSGHSSRSIAPALVAILPSGLKLESATSLNKTTRFYEARTRTVPTLPLTKVISVTPSLSRMSGTNSKTGIVQKGELVAATTFPSPRPVPDIVDPRVLNGYLGTLQKLIASAKQYPESARKSGREGKVTVQFTVLKNGAVKNIQLRSKTNYPELNEEAIAAVKRAAPFSGLPDEIDKSFLDIILPFKFKLNE